MQPFDFCRPTKVVFGAGRIAELGKIAAGYGSKVLFVTYDKAMMESIGLLDKALAPLKQAGLDVAECYGVKSNPSLDHARELVKLAKQAKPDVMVALGGGSVIDECKCIGASLGSDADIWDMVEGKKPVTASIPLIAVCTIPATSSEMNNIAVISNDAINRKEGLMSDLICPAVALLDPAITTTIPMRQTAYSSADIVSHLLEGYLSHTEPFVPMQNRYFDSMIKVQMECMERLLENPADIDARAMMMWAATFSWNGFCVLGIGPMESLIHVLGHSLSAFYDTPHGASMAIMIPAVMKYTLNKRVARYARIARNVFGLDEDDDLRAAKLGIEMMTAWLDRIGAPTSFAKGGIPTNELDKLTDNAYQSCCNFGMTNYTKEDIKKMYELSL